MSGQARELISRNSEFGVRLHTYGDARAHESAGHRAVVDLHLQCALRFLLLGKAYSGWFPMGFEANRRPIDFHRRAGNVNGNYEHCLSAEKILTKAREEACRVPREAN